MSACLTGTRPSSGVRDGMGVLAPAGAGLGDGEGTGKKRIYQQSGQRGRGWEESVSSVLQGLPSSGKGRPLQNWLPETQACLGEQGALKRQARPHLEFYQNPESIKGQSRLLWAWGHLHRQVATVPPANLSASEPKAWKGSRASSSCLSSARLLSARPMCNYSTARYSCLFSSF